LETSVVTLDSEKKRMEAKIEQGLRVLTKKDEELAELRAELDASEEEVERLSQEVEDKTSECDRHLKRV
jgi:polyhydroxyalkanoate synthesis regulator phasin